MIIELAEIESAYSKIISTNLFTGAYVLASLIAAVITIVKIVKLYLSTLEENKTFQTKDLLKLFKPYWVYLFIMALLPFGVSFLDSILTELANSVQGNFQNKWNLGDSLVIAAEQTAALETEYENLDAWDFGGQISYAFTNFGIYLGSELIAFIDDYMFSFVLAGRYLYLIFLQLAAPFAIVSSIHKETRGIFMGWIKQMGVVYLLVPGFLIANEMAGYLVTAWSKDGHYGFWMLIISIALKIFLYKKVAEYVPKIFS